MIEMVYGNCTHAVRVGVDSENRPVVAVANDNDGYYIQTFTSNADVEKFIAELREAANEAWPQGATP